MISIDTIKLTYGFETAILLLCCRIHFKTASTHELQQLIANNKVDWDHFMYLCSYHRVEPIVYKILAEVAIPASTAAIIKQKRLYLIQQSFKLAIETERLIKKLNSNSIKCIPYKGAALCKQLYGDIISRESSDIDLVIAPHDFVKVLPLMKEDGYSFENQDEYAYFKDDIYQRKKGLSFNRYQGAVREFHIEFHWRITENVNRLSKASHNLLFGPTENLLLAKESVNVLNANDHYIALFIHHAINDSYAVLRNLTDLCQVAVTDVISPDMNYIGQSLAAFRLRKAASICNSLSQDLFGINLHYILQDVPVKTSEKKYFVENLLNREKLGRYFQARLINRSVLNLKDSTADKINYILSCIHLRFIPTAKDIRIFNLPRPLYFLYPVLKPFRSMVSRNSNKEVLETARRQA